MECEINEMKWDGIKNVPLVPILYIANANIHLTLKSNALVLYPVIFTEYL